MRLSHFLDHSTRLLQEVFQWQGPADACVAQYGRHHRGLGSHDRALLADVVFAVLRYRLRWEALAKQAPWGKWEALALLGAQDHASDWAGELSSDQVAWLLQARGPVPADTPLDQRWNLPHWLIERLQAQGVGDMAALADALNQPAPVDVRVNVNQAKRDAVLRAMQAQGWDVTPTPFSPWGIRMAQRRSLASTEWFQRGDIEIQDEGSQLLAWLVGAKRSEVVADFCAGAGGKTLAIGAMMRGQGRLYAMDTSAHRLEALRPRMARSGLQEVYSLAIADEKDARLKPLQGKMNRVLVDAPCSGLGTLRRSPEIKWRTQSQDVEALAKQQASILESAAKLVRSGGRLVYATCSLLREENEAIAQGFGETHKDFVALPMGDLLKPLVKDDAQRASMVSEGGLRLWPHQHDTDGFYAAVWERR